VIAAPLSTEALTGGPGAVHFGTASAAFTALPISASTPDGIAPEELVVCEGVEDDVEELALLEWLEPPHAATAKPASTETAPSLTPRLQLLKRRILTLSICGHRVAAAGIVDNLVGDLPPISLGCCCAMPSVSRSQLLLVGSLPAASTEAALRAGAELFGDLVFALPDGETGPRAAWVGYERERLCRPHPDVVVVQETESPSGIPRHAYETPVFALRPGVSELRFDSWPRIDDALESYGVFRRLRERGEISAGLRFQIGLPFPSSAMNAFKADFARDYPIVARAYEELVARELERLLSEVPADELAIQWDMAYETQDIERVLAWTPEGAWERFAGPVTRLGRLVPEETLMGYHLCYGTFPEWPMYEARDMGVLVRMANFAVANSGRRVDWLHLAGPRYLRSEDRSFFRPLVDLEAGGARVFLGIVLPLDGIAGLRRRHATASRYLRDFGVAMYCGFGRQPGQDGMETMREHSRVVRALQPGAGA